MTVMIVGLALFLGVHLLPAIRPLRHSLMDGNERRYKGIFSLVAAVGLVLIPVGYWLATPGDRLFAPVLAARRAAPWLVTLAFILLAASHMRGHIRRIVQHPMVIGVMLWSGVHLLANGDTRGTILFGSFLAWAVIDYVASLARGRIAPFEPRGRYDAMAIVGGIIVAGIVMMLHGPLFGVRPV
ncbi:MAG TPA: NnrU family protein [Casimicrobiaceae bacterium]|nr:NnrU family protein [Casimicrobiaceae bacterium]